MGTVASTAQPPRRPPASLLDEIAGMVEEIEFSTRADLRPVFLTRNLTRLHCYNRPGSSERLVGYYRADGFDPSEFVDDVIEVWRKHATEAAASQPYRRLPRRAARRNVMHPAQPR